MSTLIEGDLSELAETRRVVVTDRLSVTERLENRGRLEDLLLDLAGRQRITDVSQILKDELGRLGLTSTRLAAVGSIKRWSEERVRT